MNRKIIAIVCLLVSSLILITISIFAFMTDREEVLTVVSVGEVKINLSEPSSQPIKYKNLTPGQIIEKDPTIENEGNVDAYIKAEIFIPYRESTKIVTSDNEYSTTDVLFSYDVEPGWTKKGNSEKVKLLLDGEERDFIKDTYILDNSLLSEKKAVLFKSMKFANITDGQGLNESTYRLPIKVYAVQSEGNEIDTAFNVFDEEDGE